MDSSHFLKKYYKFFLAAAVGAAIFWPVWLIYRPVENKSAKSAEKVEFMITKGDSSAKVARLLGEQNLVRNRLLFIFYALATGQEKRFQAGRYQLSPSMSIPQIVGIFSKGLAESEDLIITIPEGLNIFEIDQKLTDSQLLAPGEFFAEARAQKMEGYLFPDTYRLDKAETVRGVIKKMRFNFEQKIDQKPTREQLIVASILEKEVRHPEEMALVAGIIFKRLKLGMPLQIDASVTYGACLEKAAMARAYKFCDVSKIGVANFLDQDSPYNSYQRTGLPAGPISNPGKMALEATTHPQTSDYLYYLSARADGQTIFSRTSAEHERNRAKYLR